MRTFMKLALRTTLFFGIFLVSACRENPSSTPFQGSPLPPIGNAVYVLNEGNYSDATGARLSILEKQHNPLGLVYVPYVSTGVHLAKRT